MFVVFFNFVVVVVVDVGFLGFFCLFWVGGGVIVLFFIIIPSLSGTFLYSVLSRKTIKEIPSLSP